MRCPPVLTFGIALANQRSKSLGKAEKGDETDEENGICKGDSSELGRADVADHNVVNQLNDNLPCLSNHYRKGYCQVSFVEWEIFPETVQNSFFTCKYF